MSKPIPEQKRYNLMREIVDHMGETQTIDMSEDKEFFQSIQNDPDTWDALQFLKAKGYISYATNPVSHKLLQIYVKDAGLTYFEDRAEATQEKRKESRRYWITTGIAIAALVKAFLPEICAGLEWLSKQLTQQ